MTTKICAKLFSFENKNLSHQKFVLFHHKWTVNHFEVFCQDDLVYGYPVIFSKITQVEGKTIFLCLYPKGEKSNNGQFVTLYLKSSFLCYYYCVLSTENYTVASTNGTGKNAKFNSGLLT